MKATHLKTLSARIDEIHTLLKLNKITVFSAYDLIVDDNELLKQPLTLSMFVPCKDGKPLEVPFNHKKWLEYQSQGFELLFENESQNKAYNEAQKAVIFEGWEVAYLDYGIIQLSSFFGCIFFTPFSDSIDITFSKIGEPISNRIIIKTLSDLAAATIEKPLKLK